MPSSIILRGSRSLFRSKNLYSITHVHSLRLLLDPHRRFLSSTPSESSTDPQPSLESSEPAVGQPEAAEVAAGKQRTRRTRTTSSVLKDVDPVEIPEGLNILWSLGEDFESQVALPPPEIFEQVMHNLHITLHPQTQHRATYASTAGPPTEPTLGLYCPIEGGDYIIDATVRELARRTNAEVLVLDAVQLAAGEEGQFGKAADSLQLPRNPLHFSSSTGRSPSRNDEDDDEDEFGWPAYPRPQPITLALMAKAPQGRPLVAPAPRRTSTPPSKIKVFFDALVNIPSPKGDSSPTTIDRPRLVYIRDFPTLAPSSDTWYPPLLAAVRSRRRGPMSRPSSAVACPMTIIFGMTPPLLPSVSPSPPPESGLVLMSRSSTQVPVSSTKLPQVDWGESDAAEKAREKRLREKLKKWERCNTGLHSEFSVLSSRQDTEEDGQSSRLDVFLVGAPLPGMSGTPRFFSPHPPTAPTSRKPLHESKSSFFRSSVLVPTVRSPVHEKSYRIARRQEINELTMRMGVGTIGGCVEEGSPASRSSLGDETSLINSQSVAQDKSRLDLNNHERMWEEWGNRIELWSDVRHIADRAVGKIMACPQSDLRSSRFSLEPTVIPWFAIENAWVSHRANHDLRKQWLKNVSSSRGTQEADQDEDEEVEENPNNVDEVVEKLKNDGELDDHEERLLPCIVNSATMTTSFNQVHLPAHTIDSIRTIASLRLLHPQAFTQGILKEHSMSGCLLFGPPGTGKTLVVRALAKEAGCRMLAVSPSDVLDMYVGEGEKLVRAVFSLARKLSPCVIFLDEIDALFGARMSTRESGGAFAHRGVITEFMQEMDGLKSSVDDSVIVIGATNRPFDLDDAVLRRLPRRLLVDLPGEKEREEILKILLRDETLDTDVDISRLAKQTENFSGSDLKHLCVSAALDSVKENARLPWVTASSDPASQTDSAVLNPPGDGQCQPQDVNRTLEQAIPPSTDSASVIAGETAPSWTVKTETKSLKSKPSVPETSQQPRILHLRNFSKALKEITPSSSESLGSLTELRKWNEEFGEGRQSRKSQLMWGRGRFGFVEYPKKGEKNEERAIPAIPLRPSQSRILEMPDQK